MCLNVVRVFRYMFCIAGLQAENKHNFSISGIPSKHPWSHMSVKRLDDVINVYAKVPNRSSLQANSVQTEKGAIGDAQNINGLTDSEISASEQLPLEAFVAWEELLLV